MTRKRAADAPNASRMDVLVLGCLARRPMHGWQVKAELAYKHVELYARCDHGHLYWTLKRLERDGLATSSEEREGRRPARKVLAITGPGRRHLEDALRFYGGDPGGDYSDLDLFLANAWVLPREEVLAILDRRLSAVEARLAALRTAGARMTGKMPLSGELILDHRVFVLEGESRFIRGGMDRIRQAPSWGSYFGDRGIEEFAAERGVQLPSKGKAPRP